VCESSANSSGLRSSGPSNKEIVSVLKKCNHPIGEKRDADKYSHVAFVFSHSSMQVRQKVCPSLQLLGFNKT
jgi:hypothetical protein